MDEKLKVVLQVSEIRKGVIGPVPSTVLEFTGETELTLDAMRQVLSEIITGTQAAPFETVAEVAFSEEEARLHETHARYNREHAEIPSQDVYGELDVTSWDSFQPEKPKRKSPRRRTPLVCQRCGRKFRGMSVLQKYCGKRDCESVAAANFINEQILPSRSAQRTGAQAPKGRTYPTGKKTMTPQTPAVCEKCGRKYMAYNRLQKRCGEPDCSQVAAQRKLHAWNPQATVVAGQGVVSGTV